MVKGDEVQVHFPMSFWASHLNDDRPMFNGTYAFMYGPLVLAGLTESNRFFPRGDVTQPWVWMQRTSPDNLTFVAEGVDAWTGFPNSMSLIPLFE